MPGIWTCWRVSPPSRAPRVWSGSEPRVHNPCRRPFHASQVFQSSCGQRFSSPWNIYNNVFCLSSIKPPYFAIYFWSLIEKDSHEDHILSDVCCAACLDTTEARECVYILCYPGGIRDQDSALQSPVRFCVSSPSLKSQDLRAGVIFCLRARLLTICHLWGASCLEFIFWWPPPVYSGSNSGQINVFPFLWIIGDLWDIYQAKWNDK